MVLVNPVAQLGKTRDLERKNTLKQLQSALEQYYSDNSAYPSTNSVWYSSEAGDAQSNNNGNWIPGLSPDYIPSLPKDPSGGDSPLVGCTDNKRAYWYKSNGNEYAILTHCAIENAKELNNPQSPLYDPQRPTISLRVYQGGTTAASW